MSVDWHDLYDDPPPNFWIELVGGPLDGYRVMLRGESSSGLPMTRFHAPLRVDPLAIYDPHPHEVTCAPSQAVYDRGVAMRDSDHVWPYNYKGIF